jgi:2-polyprenyl-3-methyl-5-hydroxy-6-metoxy-1,4-benzoquinol methylase
MKFNNRYLKWILNEQIPKSPILLDVGCGFGYFLKICEKRGFQTYGVDVSNYALREAKKNTQAILCRGCVDLGLGFKNATFDVVTLFDVLEHLESPYWALMECHRILKTEGIIVITTPNLGAFERVVNRKNWHGFNDPTHLYLFTKYSLKHLVSKAGFDKIRINTPFHAVPPKISALFSRTFLGSQLLLIARKVRPS